MNLKLIGSLVGAGVLLFAAYGAGYDKAETEGRLALLKMKAEQYAAFQDLQDEVRKDYEARLAKLSTDLERVRVDNASRVRQLDKFKHAERDLETCRTERAALAELAVRGEKLLRDAESYLRVQAGE